MRSMKAIRVHQFGGPEVLRYEDVPTPAVGAGQVLVKVHAIGVNPVETYQRSGSNPSLKLPWTPGMDAAGVVESVGAEVTKVRPGDRVYTSDTLSGAYADYALCDQKSVHRLPAKLSFQQGAAINIPYATAYRALFHRAQAQAGETVLIHGASGGVGIAATQIARAAGLTVIGTGGTDAGRTLVREQGAHHVVDHRDAGYLDKILQLTNGQGVQIILEPQGLPVEPFLRIADVLDGLADNLLNLFLGAGGPPIIFEHALAPDFAGQNYKLRGRQRLAGDARFRIL